MRLYYIGIHWLSMKMNLTLVCWHPVGQDCFDPSRNSTVLISLEVEVGHLSLLGRGLSSSRSLTPPPPPSRPSSKPEGAQTENLLLVST